jgi:hypothetical protein
MISFYDFALKIKDFEREGFLFNSNEICARTEKALFLFLVTQRGRYRRPNQKDMFLHIKDVSQQDLVSIDFTMKNKKKIFLC